MRHRKNGFRTRVGIGWWIARALPAVTLSFISGAIHGPIRAQQQAAQSGQAQASPGQSRTQLPDGRWLIVGGETARPIAAIEDVRGRVNVLSNSPAVPRAWHSATLLADGTVLIVGGVDARGRTIAAPERFVPSTQTFERLPEGGFAPRARHTATLLTDGRVLIAAGTFGTAREDAEMWDPSADIARPLASDSTVRVSLTVTTRHRTSSGVLRRCSRTLTRPIIGGAASSSEG